MTDWLDKVIMEAIAVLNEPDGSNKAAISKYIEKKCWVPPNLQRLLPTKLRSLTTEGKLFKDKKKYRIASTLPSPRGRRKVVIRGPKKICQPNLLTMADVQKDLEKMKTMNAEEAAAFASVAVQEAEESLRAAMEAQREAEEAEKEAEKAMAFAKAISAKVKGKRKGKMICHKGRRDFPGKS